ncbi:hypothetical protein Tco_1084623 [Tanacetum coccineum]
MHQFWNTINKIGNTDAYNFKLDKKKCRVDTEVFREILQICPKLPNQEFNDLPSEDDLVTFIKELGYSRNCEMLSAICTDQMHQPWRTFVSDINRKTLCIKLATEKLVQQEKLSTSYKTYLDYATGKVPPKKARKFKKPASPKLKTVPASPKEPTQKGKRVKRPAKKVTTAPITSVVIRDTPGKSVSKKKTPAKTDRGKGIESLSDAALLEDAQLKKTLRKSKRETHKLQASGSSKGANFESEVPDEQTGKTKDTSEGIGVKPRVPDVSKEDSFDSDDDSWGNSEDENDDFNDEDDDGGFEQEEDDGHVTLTIVHDKTKGTMQSSYVSSDFTSKLLNLDNTGPDVNEIASLMNTLTVPPPPPPINPSSLPQ